MDEIGKRYRSFLSSWETAFCQIPSIINILSSYPELCTRINFIKHLNLDRLHKIQLEWISLVYRFDHPIETSFFKEYHVPIEEDSYDFFVDLSCKSFSIFLVSYFQLEPQHWYKTTVFSDINELIHSASNNSFNPEKHFEVFWLKQRLLVNKKVERRELLEKQSNAQGPPINKNDLVVKGDESKHLFN